MLATAMEQWDAAQPYFDAALVMNHRMGALPLVAYTQVAYAEMLARQAHPETAAPRSSSPNRLSQQPGTLACSRSMSGPSRYWTAYASQRRQGVRFPPHKLPPAGGRLSDLDETAD